MNSRRLIKQLAAEGYKCVEEVPPKKYALILEMIVKEDSKRYAPIQFGAMVIFGFCENTIEYLIASSPRITTKINRYLRFVNYIKLRGSNELSKL